MKRPWLVDWCFVNNFCVQLNDTNSYLPTVQGCPGQSRDLTDFKGLSRDPGRDYLILSDSYRCGKLACAKVTYVGHSFIMKLTCYKVQYILHSTPDIIRINCIHMDKKIGL